jgi:FixJ family two-component response regulator
MPALLVLDRELPWGGGDGVLAWLREEKVASGLPVVLTSTADSPPDVAEDFKPPVIQFLPKPFALTALLESVRAAIAEKEREERFHLHRAAIGPEYFIG